jgi:hypothetical protein
MSYLMDILMGLLSTNQEILWHSFKIFMGVGVLVGIAVSVYLLKTEKCLIGITEEILVSSIVIVFFTVSMPYIMIIVAWTIVHVSAVLKGVLILCAVAGIAITPFVLCKCFNGKPQKRPKESASAEVDLFSEERQFIKGAKSNDYQINDRLY